MLLSRIVARLRGLKTPLLAGFMLLALLLTFDASFRRKTAVDGREGGLDLAGLSAGLMGPGGSTGVAEGGPALPRVQILGVVRSLNRLHVEMAIYNDGEGVVEGRVWGAASYAGASGQWVQRAAPQTFKARIKTFKAVEFPVPPGDDGRFVSYEIFVSDGVTGEVVRTTGVIPGSST